MTDAPRKKSARMYAEAIEAVRLGAKDAGITECALVDAIIKKAWKNSDLLSFRARAEINIRGGRGRKSNRQQYALYLTDTRHKELRELAHKQGRHIGTTLEAAIHLYFRGPGEKRGEMGLLEHGLSVPPVYYIGRDDQFRRAGAIQDGETVFIDHKAIFFGITRRSESNLMARSAQCWELLGRCRSRKVKGYTSVSEIASLLELPCVQKALKDRWDGWNDEGSSKDSLATCGFGFIRSLLEELNLSLVKPDSEDLAPACTFPDSIPFATRVDIAAAYAASHKEGASKLAVASGTSKFDGFHSRSGPIEVFKPDDIEANSSEIGSI